MHALNKQSYCTAPVKGQGYTDPFQLTIKMVQEGANGRKRKCRAGLTGTGVQQLNLTAQSPHSLQHFYKTNRFTVRFTG